VAVLAAVAVVAIAAAAVLLPMLRDNGQRTPAAPGSTATSTSPQASASLLPATSESPAAGVCGSTTGSVVTVRIEPDAPNPRCASVTSAQSLRVVNGTSDYGQSGHSVTVTWIPHQPFTLRPGQARTFPQHFGAYLAPGVHDLQTGPAYRAQIWLH
jgi:hypothetical protein